ncbi:MAG: hypothetical protein GF390_03485, partial [Candidatus Pacebacteria bacterium]|nr:hypothetical protein [Candidatus Paceibacterota bacterium]
MKKIKQLIICKNYSKYLKRLKKASKKRLSIVDQNISKSQINLSKYYKKWVQQTYQRWTAGFQSLVAQFDQQSKQIIRTLKLTLLRFSKQLTTLTSPALDFIYQLRSLASSLLAWLNNLVQDLLTTGKQLHSQVKPESLVIRVASFLKRWQQQLLWSDSSKAPQKLNKTIKIKKKTGVIFNQGWQWQDFWPQLQQDWQNFIAQLQQVYQRHKKRLRQKSSDYLLKLKSPMADFYRQWSLKQLKKHGVAQLKAWSSSKKTWLKRLGFKRGRGRPRTPWLVRTWRWLKKTTHQLKRQLKRMSKNWQRTRQRSQKKARQYQRQTRQLVRQQLIARLVRHRRALLSLITTVLIILTAWGSYQYVFKDLPLPQDLITKKQAVTTRILDRHGQLLFRIYKDENRTLVPLSQVSPHLINATVAIEDKDFYLHHGFSVRGITRALMANIKGEEIMQGGSTITQQLVKNRLLTPERTIQRKLREIIVSVLVEGTYSKEEILEMYLNQVAYGGSTYGIEEAAWRYFNKPAVELNLAESALLAGLPQAPSLYSPFGPTPELAYARQEEVLRRMVEDGYITLAEAEQAKQQPLEFRQDTIDIKAPHFVMYVKKLLAEKYSEELLYEGGLEIRTTLDLELQDQAQQLVTDEINELQRLRVSNGAALVTNPQTGEILVMIGSKDYFDFAHDGQVNVTIRPRQPGSSIKPLTYAVALEQGKNPASIIQDSPITYHLAGSPPYSPQNYDGKFHGRVTLREALASSYNVPAVKTLAEVGVNNLIDKAEAMGITTWQDRNRFGLSLTLGGGEVLMTDMATAYSTFANLGETVKLNPFLEIRDYQGELLYRNSCVFEHKGCLG